MHSNVVPLGRRQEACWEALRIGETSRCIQQAVIAWLDLSEKGSTVSVLHLAERPALLSERSMLFGETGSDFVRRFVQRFCGSQVSRYHRTIAADLVAQPKPERPVARLHRVPGQRPEFRRVSSVVLPFAGQTGLLIVMFDW